MKPVVTIAGAMALCGVACNETPPKPALEVQPAVAQPSPGATRPPPTRRPPLARPPSVARRYVSPPGPGPSPTQNWELGPRPTLGTRRMALTDAEALQVETRLQAWLPGVKPDYLARQILYDWPSYTLLFERVAGDAGDKVVVSGFAPFVVERHNVTVQLLRNLRVDDGGCELWRVIYDVRSGAFEALDCNGEA
jgi:hypothetical protein